MDKKRKYPNSQQKRAKLKSEKNPRLKTIDSSSSSNEEIPETPSPSSVVSASPPDPEQSLINQIEEYSSSEESSARGATTSQLEKSLIQEIDSDTSLENEDHYATTLIESDSDATTSQGTRNLHRSVIQRHHPTTPSTKDAVDIPFLSNPPEHPLSVIAKRPKPLRNGLVQELSKILLDYRSKENFWQYDNKLGIGDPDTEVVHVKSIKKFHSHCLLVDIQRRGERRQEEEEQILLHLNWDSCFQKLKAGDKLMVNFRKQEPKLLNCKLVHFFPFARPEMDGGAPK